MESKNAMIPLRDQATGEENVDFVCTELRAAMKGMGTNDTKLIKHMVARRTNEEMMTVVKRYLEMHTRELIDDIKSDTSFNFKNTLVAMATDKAVLDARLVKAAVKGLGTNETKINQILCVRTPAELKEMCAAYEKEFKVTALKDIEDDTSGNLKKLYQTLLASERTTPPDSQIDQDVQRIYKAGEGKWGTNEAVFIEIFAGYSYEYIMKLDKAYQAQHKGHTLRWVVKDEFSGCLKDALLVLVTPVGEYWAGVLRKAMDRLGTDDSVLIRVLVSQRHVPGRFKAIDEAFTLHNAMITEARKPKRPASGRNPNDAAKVAKAKSDKPPKPLKQWIIDETSGDYKNALLGIWENFYNAPASKPAQGQPCAEEQKAPLAQASV